MPVSPRPSSRRTTGSGAPLSRRGVLLGALGGAGAAAALAGAAPATAAPARSYAGATTSSVAGAFAFLAEKLDQYGSGDELRVPRSYTGGFFQTPTFDFVSSFAYDDALMIMAWLASGSADHRGRAVLLGDALLYAQANDPIGDGRTRASYQPNPFITGDGTPYIGSPAAYSGNQAWVGMAMCHLHAATGEQRFLDGALRLATWLQENTEDLARAPYGYTGGRSADDVPFTFKATEHNIDISAFFTMLATLTGDAVWTARADVARSFLVAMQAEDGHLWTGTNPDGTTTNYYPIPADGQTWAYLATLDDRYGPAVQWVLDNLMATDGRYEGSSFSNADVTKVWFEGTAQLALALQERGAARDDVRQRRLLAEIVEAQASIPTGDGRGVVSASSDGLDSGFGDLYYASLHTGATAWYLLAAQRANPFQLGF
ncbi:hypothetical protein WDZ16_10210 [Pseudokineococcus marinus]|uniref:Uncharacterized protein n=1 Tax=Pseudokineococcus marinus TaxID=351215 RepID=A0A849BLZ0_9ACTN|nr:hypothetical protein [Pseudokineococcus marinus]NNH22077.1 hypothetical protein [Pseudokineococcus marinus]